METRIRGWWQGLRSPRGTSTTSEISPAIDRTNTQLVEPVRIEAKDPLLAYLLSSSGVVEIDKLEMDSRALREMKAQGVRITVPLIGQGELIGLLNLGPRLSEQEYSADDRRLLSSLATQAAPALRVAQMVRQQQAEAQERERLEHELKVARLIQQTLLPKELPAPMGWQVAAHWQPAREVGGDFYDFLYLPDGRLGFIVGDVTDKGVPAAMVMATTRSILRAAAERIDSPGKVLERANHLLYPDIPPNMFVTCMYALLDPESGELNYANAGHSIPYLSDEEGVSELRATGMPLGLMPDMTYEEKRATIEAGQNVLFYSDGLIEAHNGSHEMFGGPRLCDLLAEHPGGSGMIGYLLEALHAFTGSGWEQEDDVTFVTLERYGIPTAAVDQKRDGSALEILAEFAVPSEPGNERQAMERVGETVAPLSLPAESTEKLKTAVAEATMNAMEHGNLYRPEEPVSIRVLASPQDIVVRITDSGVGQPISEIETPDIDAKLAGEQTPRGWGLFLIKNMVDEMNVNTRENRNTVELILHRKGGADAANAETT